MTRDGRVHWRSVAGRTYVTHPWVYDDPLDVPLTADDLSDDPLTADDLIDGPLGADDPIDAPRTPDRPGCGGNGTTRAADHPVGLVDAGPPPF